MFASGCDMDGDGVRGRSKPCSAHARHCYLRSFRPRALQRPRRRMPGEWMQRQQRVRV